MKQLLAYLKFLTAFMFLSATGTSMFANFDISIEDLVLLIPLFILFGVYLFYLVKTGIWNLKDEYYLKSPLAITGLVIHFLGIIILLIWSIDAITTDSEKQPPFFAVIPMVVLGILMGIYDIYKFNQGKKFRKFVKNGGLSYSKDAGYENPLSGTIFMEPKANIGMIRVESQISFKEYLEILYMLTYKNGMSIYINAIGIVMVVGSIVMFVQQPETMKDYTVILRSLFGLFLAISIPISVYFSAKKNYLSNKRLGEKIIYEFYPDEMKATGESFITLRKWAQTYKIEELKNWFLIYESNQVANLIPKSEMSDQDISNLRSLFLNINEPGIKVKLKHSFD